MGLTLARLVRPELYATAWDARMDALYRWNARMVAWVIETGVVPRRVDIVRARGVLRAGVHLRAGVGAPARWEACSLA